MSYLIEYYCCNDIGRCRSNNQDNYICQKQYIHRGKDGEITYPLQGSFSSRQPSMLGVFDGMGGEERGEEASLIAAECAAQTRIDNPVRTMLDFCTTANNRICDFAKQENVSSTGTTAALLVFTEKLIVLCNIGDSRVYRFRNHDLEQLSVDHYSAAPSGSKPALSQNLGIPASEMIIDPYVKKQDYKHDDIYLLCTDGLTDMLSDEEIMQALESEDFENVAEKLKDRALDNGGIDNITIIVCRVTKEKWDLFRFLHRQ